jgi:hypothetical protein
VHHSPPSLRFGAAAPKAFGAGADFGFPGKTSESPSIVARLAFPPRTGSFDRENQPMQTDLKQPTYFFNR